MPIRPHLYVHKGMREMCDVTRYQGDEWWRHNNDNMVEYLEMLILRDVGKLLIHILITQFNILTLIYYKTLIQS